MDSRSTVKAHISAVFLFGSPSRIIADQGRCFPRNELQDFCQNKHIKLHLIATGASRANGQVERTMGTLKNMFTTVETTGRSWQDTIGEIQLALNCTTNRVTKSSPLELLIGKTARPYGLLLPENTEEKEIDISNVRQQAIQNIENSANEERNQTILDPKFKGPFVISEILEGDRYILKTLDGERWYKYSHDRLKKMPDTCVPTELDVCGDDGNSNHDDTSTPISQDHHYHST
ncbi:uncharacterized protein [Bombus fervidus]|uniref:uncharacterized protein n=1 Tax=Bombus fervidus TaxID=203811 RepID=UPI003AB1C911